MVAIAGYDMTMSTALRMPRVSVEEYLAGEASSAIKHEYVDGRIYAMSGRKNAHNRLASRVLVSLGRQLDGNRCEPFNSDTKIRIRHGERTYFYYPDVSVVCDSNSDAEVFQDRPVVIVEVLSDSTRRIDEGEKRDRYFLVDSLDTYVLLEVDRPMATVFQRVEKTGEFVSTIYEGDAAISLPVIDSSITFADIYGDRNPPV